MRIDLFDCAECAVLDAEATFIAMSRHADRQKLDRQFGATDIVEERGEDGIARIMELTNGVGAESVLECVGMEESMGQAMGACRPGGTVSVPGVYGGFADKLPVGALMNKGLTLKTGQTHVHRYLRPLLDRILKEEIDPSFVVTHRMRLDDAPQGYATFNGKEDECIKIVLKP